MQFDRVAIGEDVLPADVLAVRRDGATPDPSVLQRGSHVAVHESRHVADGRRSIVVVAFSAAAL